jgi:preprotein translocase subunit SecA
MDFLEKIGDFFVGLTALVERLITRLFGASNERMIRKLGFERSGEVTRILPGSTLDRINQLESELQKLSDEELRQSTSRFRARLARGETLDDLLPEAFASVREAGRRYLKMRHYDVQMIGGYVLHKGMIGEMVTGEGKTLVATLPTFLNALAGKVHVVTVNDYLARRDMEWMGPLYTGLGLTVGCIQSHQETDDKAQAYACDITYGTNNEFGFDYLRDNMKPSRELQVQGPLHYAVVDEIDNILIDEARTPLIISGPSQDDPERYRKADRVARQLKRDVHFEVKEKEHTCHLTEQGIRFAEELAGVESFYTAGNMEWPHLIDNSLRAHHLYKRDVNYVVMNGEIIIVDEFTGRLMKGRQWSDGLHQAVEAKEGVKIKSENQTLATITLQNYFKLYKKLSGMTGTAMTEANEFWKVYKLDVVAIPSNRPMQRINHPDTIFRTVPEKYKAVVDEIRQVHQTGRPILVGTVSIESSENLSHALKQWGIRHEVLNAKHHEREADIIAQAGRLNAVTIATNMAGRGTDIILGGNPDQAAWEQLKHTYASRLEIPKSEWDALTRKISDDEGMAEEGRKVAELGGLHVIGTERHEARRIDLQLRGRSGRQGDPGSSRFFLSLDDDLMRIFAGDWVKNVLTRLGMQEGEAIESPMVSRQIERAQKRVEERHFEQRKNLLEYDEVMDQQRRRVYSFRQEILDGADCRNLIFDMLREQVSDAAREMLDPTYGLQTTARWATQAGGIQIEARDLKDNDPELITAFLKEEAVRQADDLILEKIEEDFPKEVEDEREWNWGAFSKWANARWGLKTTDRQLKEIGRDGLHDVIFEQAKEAIEQADFAPVKVFLEKDYGRRSLAAFLANQFTLDIAPERFQGLSPEAATDLVLGELRQLYEKKEVDFPVSVGMSRFMADHAGGNVQRYDRPGLAQWATARFAAPVSLASVEGSSREEIVRLLSGLSEQFRVRGQGLAEAEKLLDRAYGPLKSSDSSQMLVQDRSALDALQQWADEQLDSDLTAERMAELPRSEVHRLLADGYQRRFRPELREAERALLLEVLDTSWKDHLHFMDHLRQGIGLVGYAQKDPKVEYRREGMKAFDQMWKGIGQQVTGAIFRLEKESPGFVGSLWRITEVRHDEAPPEELSSAGEPGSELEGGDPAGRTPEQSAIEPIRNRETRVGRNDPCPCGSGKKFKHCHMQTR